MAEPAAAADNGVPAAEHDDDDVEELEEEPAAAALQPVDQNQGVVVVSNFKGKPCPNLDENGQPCGRLLNGRYEANKDRLHLLPSPTAPLLQLLLIE